MNYNKLLLALGLLGLLAYSVTYALDTGAITPGTFVNDASYGNIAWSNPTFASADDTSYATATVTDSDFTNYLKATNLGFSIPEGTTIDGILVEALLASTTGGSCKGGVTYDRARIVKADGSIGSTNRTGVGTGFFPGTPSTYTTFGSTSDLWGESWTYTDINDADFGFAITATGTDPEDCTARVDHIRITVSYSLSSGTTLQQSAIAIF